MYAQFRIIYGELDSNIHYGTPMLCRVSVALGKGLKTLGKAFAECHTRQRPHGKILADKGVFAECYFWALGKGFTEC